MADDVQVTMPPGGNGMNLKVGNKALGITGPIVIPVLCLVLIGAIGWIRSNDLKDNLAQTNAHLNNLYTRQEQIRLDLTVQTKEMLLALQQNRDITGSRLSDQNAHLQDQTAEMRKQHAVIIHNQHTEPNQHLTLDLPLPPHGK